MSHSQDSGWRISPASILGLLLAAPLLAQRGVHVDTRHGFRVQAPAKWQRQSVEKDRRFVLGRYRSRKSYPTPGDRWSHVPELRIFVLSKVDAERARAHDKQHGVQAWSPYYLDYADYLARNLSGQLTEVSKSLTEEAGVPCRKLVLRRAITGGSDYYLEAWEFELEAAWVTIEFHIRAEQRAKLQRQVSATLRSFKLIEIVAQPVGQPFDLPLWVIDAKRWRALPMGDRLERRVRYQEVFLAAVKADLGSGWRLKKTPHFLLLSKAPARYTSDVGKAAEACRAWLDEQLGGVSDEMVMPAVIRIFASSAERDRYRARSGKSSPYVPSIRELILGGRSEPARNLGAMGYLYQGLLHQYLHDQDGELYRHVPAWLRVGIYQYLRQSRLERGKLAFIVNDYEREVIRDGSRTGTLGTVRQLIEHQVATSEDQAYRLRYQRGRLIRLMMRRKSVFRRQFLAEYLGGVRVAMATHTVPVEATGAGVVPGRTEDAAEALEKTWRQTHDELRSMVNAAVCDFGRVGWQKIEVAYAAFNKRL